MQIDWFTFGAQVFNFVLLVYLLKRFLYRPVLNAIEQRAAQVQGRLEEARRKEEEATAERERYRALQEDLERSRSSVLGAAEEEAERRRRELTAKVRSEVQTVREEWRESLRRQRESFLDEMSRRMSRDVFDLVERVVEALTDSELEDRTVDVFLSRLSKADESQRKEFTAAVEGEEGRVRVRSSFPLTSEQRRRFAESMSTWLGPSEPDFQWEDDSDLALGIEVRAGDRKIAWSVDDYLDVLRSETAAYLDAETRSPIPLPDDE